MPNTHDTEQTLSTPKFQSGIKLVLIWKFKSSLETLFNLSLDKTAPSFGNHPSMLHCLGQSLGMWGWGGG